MNLKNCPECGRIYVDNPSGLCPACLEEEDENELRVIEYMRENGKSSVEEIKNATGVREGTILRMLKKGRFLGEFQVEYPCESCGTLISEGRVCLSCSKSIMDQVKGSGKNSDQYNKSGVRMYTRKE